MKILVNVICLSAFALFAGGCTDAPVNDGDSKTVQVVADVAPKDIIQLQRSNSHVDANPIVLSDAGETSGEGSVDHEAKKAANLRKPIIYGVGAAGITLNTTLKESETLLTPPLVGPLSNGGASYNEELIVYWKPDDDRKPQIIIARKGYLGTMAAGKFGDLDFQTKFTAYKGENPEEGAARLAREFYIEFEKPNNPDYDCLAKGSCALNFGDQNQSNLVLVFPGAQLLIAKEEFQLAEIRIIRNADPGLLANNLDLLTGDILVPDEKSFSFGDTFADVMGRLTADERTTDPEIFVESDYFGYLWTGVWLSFDKSDFDILSTTPQDADALKTVAVVGTFQKYLTLGGSRILVMQDKDFVSVAMEEEIDPVTGGQDFINLSATRFESKLKMSTPIRLENSEAFVKGLAELMKSKLSETYDVVSSNIWGSQNTDKNFREIQSVILAYDAKTSEGLSIVISLDEEQGSLRVIEFNKMSAEVKPFDATILPNLMSDVTLPMVEQEIINEDTKEPVLDEAGNPKTESVKANSLSSLAGLELNGLIRLSEVDNLGRKEATAELLDENGGALTQPERVKYEENAVFVIPEDDRGVSRQQSYISVGSREVVVGLIPIGRDDNGLLARIVSLESSSVYGKLQDFCGMGEALTLKLAMKTSEVDKALVAAVKSQKASNSKFKCPQMRVTDVGGLGLLKKLYFTSQRLVLNFSDRALSSVSIYLPDEAVNKNVPAPEKEVTQ